jgi:hypothetical protein
MSNCNHDVIAWRDENGEARLWGCYHCKVKFVPMTQLVDEVLEEREACAKVCEEVLEQYRGTDMGKHAELVGDDCATAIRARGRA